jgi:hypothetical protein
MGNATCIRIPLTPEERGEIDRAIKASGLSPSEYIRQRCRGRRPRAYVPPDFYLLCERLERVRTPEYDADVLSLLDDLRRALLEPAPDARRVRAETRSRRILRKDKKSYNAFLSISIGREEKERFETSAKQLGISLSEWMRKKVLGYSPEPLDPYRFLVCAELLARYLEEPVPAALPVILSILRIVLIPKERR